MSPGSYNTVLTNSNQNNTDPSFQGSSGIDSESSSGSRIDLEKSDIKSYKVKSDLGCLGRILHIFDKRKYPKQYRSNYNTHKKTQTQTPPNTPTTISLNSNTIHNINQMSVNSNNFVPLKDKTDTSKLSKANFDYDCNTNIQSQILYGNEKVRPKSSNTQVTMKNKKFIKSQRQLVEAPINKSTPNYDDYDSSKIIVSDKNLLENGDNNMMESDINQVNQVINYLSNEKIMTTSTGKISSMSTNDGIGRSTSNNGTKKISNISSNSLYSDMISSDEEEDIVMIESIAPQNDEIRPNLGELITQLDADALRLNEIIVGNSIDGESSIYIKKSGSPKPFRPRSFEKRNRRPTSLVYLNSKDITKITEDSEVEFRPSNAKVFLSYCFINRKIISNDPHNQKKNIFCSIYPN